MKLVLFRRLLVVDSVEILIELFRGHGLIPCLYFLELKLEVSIFMRIDNPRSH